MLTLQVVYDDGTEFVECVKADKIRLSTLPTLIRGQTAIVAIEILEYRST